MEEDRPLDISIKHQDSDTGENFKSSHYILVSINSNETPVVRTNIDDRAIILFRIVEVLSTLLGVGSTSPQTTARLDQLAAQTRLLVTAVGTLQDQMSLVLPNGPPTPKDLG